jgi:hypothetical protein
VSGLKHANTDCQFNASVSVRHARGMSRVAYNTSTTLDEICDRSVGTADQMKWAAHSLTV